jgi:phospholipid transport system transporter-binding protein
MTTEMIVQDGDGFRIESPVTMATVSQLIAEGDVLFNPGEVTVDFGNVKEVDSSAVSLMLNWLREGNKHGCQFHFANLPENLKSLAALYGVLELISPS